MERVSTGVRRERGSEVLELFKMVKAPIKYFKSRKYVLFSRLRMNALKPQKNNEDMQNGEKMCLFFQ